MELLVVIAIIGILASVVLASLNTARAKGGDAAIKANLANIRAQAEILYDTNSNYTGVCTTNSTVMNQVTAAATAAGIAATSSAIATAGSATTAVCHESAAAWAANSPLKSVSANSWCVDSTGASKLVTAAYLGANALVCP